MIAANDWILQVSKNRAGEKELPKLFLMKTHSSKPWMKSEKTAILNEKIGVFEN